MYPEKITTKDYQVDAGELRRGTRTPIHLVLDNIRSAYNVGSAFRTADAVCVQKIHLCGMTAYPPNHKLAKTALGSTDSVPWQYYQNTREAIDILKAQNIQICLVELTTKSENFWHYAYPSPVALVFGHEIHGVQEDIFPLANAFINIPMRGKKSTLNVSTAIGVVLYEALRVLK